MICTKITHMKKSLLGILLISFSLSLQAQVRITEVMSSGGTSDWFELTNYGVDSVNISGWKFDDNSFNFATSVLLNGVTSVAPNERVMFCENASAAYASTFRTFWGLFIGPILSMVLLLFPSAPIFVA